MKDKQKERRRLIKIYGSIYSRAKVDLNVCVYCGFPRQCLDHVPPISSIEGINLKSYWKYGGKLLLYPSCIECNNFLGSKYIISLVERLELLETIYEGRLNKIEVWSDYELKELGYNLRSYVMNQAKDLDRLQTKHSYILDNIDRQWLIE